jgi:hypothetical protein
MPKTRPAGPMLSDVPRRASGLNLRIMGMSLTVRAASSNTPLRMLPA